MDFSCRQGKLRKGISETGTTVQKKRGEKGQLREERSHLDRAAMVRVSLRKGEQKKIQERGYSGERKQKNRRNFSQCFYLPTRPMGEKRRKSGRISAPSFSDLFNFTGATLEGKAKESERRKGRFFVRTKNKEERFTCLGLSKVFPGEKLILLGKFNIEEHFNRWGRKGRLLHGLLNLGNSKAEAKSIQSIKPLTSDNRTKQHKKRESKGESPGGEGGRQPRKKKKKQGKSTFYVS